MIVKTLPLNSSTVKKSRDDYVKRLNGIYLANLERVSGFLLPLLLLVVLQLILLQVIIPAWFVFSPFICFVYVRTKWSILLDMLFSRVQKKCMSVTRY